MTEQSPCPECGKPLPAGSAHDLCPACLMGQVMASRTLDTAAGNEPVAPPPSPEEIADKFPQFEVLECLGRGGMGVVYKARQKSLDRWVAIKVLAPERVHEERFAEHFEREAKTLAKMSHPNIVTVFDHGQTDGLFYIVMEFVDGLNLRDLLREAKMEPEQALAIIPPICDALEYAHDKGVVHRDIKPENILLDREGRVKIADFGIASLVGVSGEKSGTPPYMAPEQENGIVDRRADIYALGVVLYEMLTGERPNKELVAPSKKVQIDIRLDEIVLRALEKTPELRYQTAGEFRTVLETISTVDEKPPGGGQKGPVNSEAWLALIDAGNYARSWETATPYFQSSLTRDEWIGRLQNVRHPLGKVLARKQTSATFTASGQRFEVQYETSFAGLPAAVETLTFDKQSGGEWLAAGYLILPTGNAVSYFSRTAIAGACWAPFFFIAFLLMFARSHVSTGEHQGPTWWQYLLMITVLPLGITAPFGTTILGWVAVSKIRRSAGKLYGMGLAVFDGLLFPLLALTGLIGWIWHWVFDDLIRIPIMEGRHELSTLERMLVTNSTAFTVIATLLTLLVASFLIIRRVWRALNDVSASATSSTSYGIPDEKPTIKSPSSRRSPIFFMVLILLAIAAVYFYQEWRFKYKAFGSSIEYGIISPEYAYAELLTSNDKRSRDAALQQIVENGMQNKSVIAKALDNTFGSDNPLSIPPMASLAMNRFNLIHYLHHPDTNQRLAAVYASRWWRSTGKVEILTKFLDDTDSNVLGQTVYELGYIGDRSVLAVLENPKFDKINFIEEVRAALKAGRSIDQTNTNLPPGKNLSFDPMIERALPTPPDEIVRDLDSAPTIASYSKASFVLLATNKQSFAIGEDIVIRGSLTNGTDASIFVQTKRPYGKNTTRLTVTVPGGNQFVYNPDALKKLPPVDASFYSSVEPEKNAELLELKAIAGQIHHGQSYWENTLSRETLPPPFESKGNYTIRLDYLDLNPKKEGAIRGARFAEVQIEIK